MRRNGLGFAEAVDHGDGVEKRVQLVNDWFEAEGDFHTFSDSPGDRAASAAFAILRAFSRLALNIREIRLCCRIQSKSIHGYLLSAPHMLAVRGKSSRM